MAELTEALSTALLAQREGLPSIFEVKAQDSLQESICPAVKHIVKIFAQNNPAKFGWILRWYDELFTIVELSIQQHFLSSHLASFSEYYYDLHRKEDAKAVFNKSKYLKFGLKMHLKCLAALCIFPYLLRKLDNYYCQIKEQRNVEFQEISILKKIVYQVYPYIHALWNGLILYYNFMYAIGKVEFHAPLYHLLKMKLMRNSPFDSNLSSYQNTFTRLVTQFLSGGVHIAIFIIQFIERWYTEENEDIVKQATQTPILEPPIFKQRPLVPEKGKCPLCHSVIHNEAALMTSGYVFCYTCIYKHVRATNRCPVTGYQTNLNHVIKVYPLS